MYTKLIKSGSILEEYIYQYEPVPPKVKSRSRRPRPKDAPRHPFNIRQATTRFHRTVIANLDRFPNPPHFLTLTFAQNIRFLDDANPLLARFFQRFRYRYPDIEWIAVPEFQKRGAVHFHILLYNYPNEEAKNERSSRRLATLWRHGFLDIIPTDGNHRIASYMSKYMRKAMHDYRLFGKKAYSASRGILRPVSYTSNFQIAFVRELSGVPSIVSKRTYPTRFLGECQYTKYKLA